MSKAELKKLITTSYSSLPLDELYKLRSKLIEELKEVDNLIDNKYNDSNITEKELLDLCDYRALVNTAKCNIENFFYKKKLNIKEKESVMYYGSRTTTVSVNYMGMKYVPEIGN